MSKKMAEKLKEGVTVEELEKFARKYTTEVFIVFAIIIAAISSSFSFFLRFYWSLYFGAIAAIVSLLVPEKIEAVVKKLVMLSFGKDKSTEIIIGIVRIVLAIFLPFVIFAELGLLAGLAYHYVAKKGIKQSEEQNSSSESPENPQEPKI